MVRRGRGTTHGLRSASPLGLMEARRAFGIGDPGGPEAQAMRYQFPGSALTIRLSSRESSAAPTWDAGNPVV
jgi:hypothetical protein